MSGPEFKDWDGNTGYNINDCILDSQTTPHLHYQLLGVTRGNGPFTPYPERPFFPPASLSSQALGPIEWQDVGTSPPALVTAGQSGDQTLAESYTLTQVHPKYYFNLSTGVVVSTIHSRSFGWQTNYPGSYTPIQTASNPIIDPVLFVTVYLKPMDAESPWSEKDLFPAPTFGLSMSSPTTNFYLGFNSEVRRYIQIALGASVASPARLANISVSTSNASPPATAQKVTMGGFAGVSFNLSGFIQTLFGGK